MNILSGTTRRLLSAFGVFFVLLGTASYFALAGLVEVHESMHSVANYNAGVRTALTLASAVRDQYAHQAHTIILGNDSHLGFHRHASDNVQALIRQLEQQLTDPEQRAFITEIAHSSQELNQLFLEQIVPAVLKKDQAAVNREHARALEIVASIQDRADSIAARYGMAIASSEQRAGVVERDSFRYVTLSQLCAILFAVAMAAYIGRSVARPLGRLEVGAARLGSGDLNTVIHIESGDEFGRLAQQFNAMTVALKEHQEKLVQSEKLAAIGRLAAGIAHEINNPLGVILGYVRLMKRKAEGELGEELRVIEEEAVRCQVIVEGLLDLARPWKQSPTPVALRELCDDIVTRLQESQQLNTIRFEIEGHADSEGNEQALRQVLLNLVKNAAEAAGPTGWVRITLDTVPEGSASVSIADSGPGLTLEARERLFEAFFTTKPHGTGLGLAVSKAIIQAHGGDIEADQGPEGGTVFRLHLPLPHPIHIPLISPEHR